jgi:hypothetical protein
VTVDGVWIGNRIFEDLQNISANNYGSLNELHSKDHCNYSTHNVALLCLLQSLADDGSQQCPLLLCSRSYQLATVSQLTHYSSCRLSTDRLQSSTVNCCWSSPAQSFLASGLVGIHDHIFVPSRLLCVLKWGLIFEERRGLTAAGHSPSTGESDSH